MRRNMILFLAVFSLMSVAASSTSFGESLTEESHQAAWCPTRPALIVWTSRRCVPCQSFWHDLQNDASFRKALTSRYCVQWIDADVYRNAANQRGIHTVPTFETPDEVVAGYQGKHWLLDRLTAVTIENGFDGASTNSLQANVDEVQSHLTEEQADISPAPLPELLRPRRSPATAPRSNEAPNTPESPEEPSPHPTRIVPPESIDAATTPQRNLQSRPTRQPSFWSRMSRAFTQTAPIALTALELAGLISGTAATGGVGTLAVAALWRVLNRRRQRQRSRRSSESSPTDDTQKEEGTPQAATRAPFPRQLDEARELLALRQSEGRVAVLDALRGMFLDDELTKLTSTGDDTETTVARRLQTSIDARVDEVAPLSTTLDA